MHETDNEEDPGITMNVYEDRTRELEYAASPVARTHPWIDTHYGADRSRPPGTYRNFVAHLEQIRSSLEDFLPWGEEPSVQSFYGFLEWLNGPESCLESNDCAFGGAPKPHSDAYFLNRKLPLRCDGRVMLFYRDLRRNTQTWSSEWLRKRFESYLQKVDPKFAQGAVGLAQFPTRFEALAAAGSEAEGFLLAIHFFAFGRTERETFNNLQRLVRGLLKSAKMVSRGRMRRREM